jgi:hypothetical protein
VSEDNWNGAVKGVINPGRQLPASNSRIAHTPQTVMVMHLDNLAGLMAPRASQIRHTKPRVVVTSTLMVSLSVNLRCTKRAIYLVNLFIPPMDLLLLLGSSKHFLTFSLCNCVCSISLSGDFFPYPYITQLLSFGPHRRFLCISLCFFTCASTLSSSPERFPTTPPPSVSTFLPPCQEKGEIQGEARCTTSPSPGATNFPPPN